MSCVTRSQWLAHPIVQLCAMCRASSCLAGPSLSHQETGAAAATLKPPTQFQYLSVYKCTSAHNHNHIRPVSCVSAAALVYPVLQVGCRLPHSLEGTEYLGHHVPPGQHGPFMQILHGLLSSYRTPGGLHVDKLYGVRNKSEYIPGCIYLGSSFRSLELTLFALDLMTNLSDYPFTSGFTRDYLPNSHHPILVSSALAAYTFIHYRMLFSRGPLQRSYILTSPCCLSSPSLVSAHPRRDRST